ATLTVDWPALMRFKRSLVDPITERTERTWARMGVEQFHGRARFVGPTTLAVGSDRLTGRRVLIGAGAMPAPLRFPGAERLAASGASTPSWPSTGPAASPRSTTSTSRPPGSSARSMA